MSEQIKTKASCPKCKTLLYVDHEYGLTYNLKCRNCDFEIGGLWNIHEVLSCWYMDKNGIYPSIVANNRKDLEGHNGHRGYYGVLGAMKPTKGGKITWNRINIPQDYQNFGVRIFDTEEEAQIAFRIAHEKRIAEMEAELNKLKNSKLINNQLTEIQ